MSPSRVVNDLRALTLADYEGVVARYVEHCARVPGVRAIYRFGSIGAPGTSDVDLIVVLEDDVATGETHPNLGDLRVWDPRWQADGVFTYCFMHDALVCTAGMFRFLRWHTVGSEPVLVAGAAVPVESPDPESARMIRLVQGLDFSIARLHELTRLEEQSGISMRQLIPMLWSVTHTGALLEQEGVGLCGEWHSLIARLRELRAAPVREISPAQVERLIGPTQELFERGAASFIDRLVAVGALPPGATNRECAVASPHRGELTVYRAGSSVQGRARVAAELISRSVSIRGRRVVASWTRVTLPPSVLVHHLAYLSRQEEHAALAVRLARQAGAGAAERALGSTSAAYRGVIEHRVRLAAESTRLRRMTGVPLHGPAILGLPVGGVVTTSRPVGSLRYRALKALLDRRVLPAGTIRTRAELL